MWYSVEFSAVPDVGLPIGAGLVGYMKLGLLVLLVYFVTLSKRLPDVGFTFSLNRGDWREALINFALFAAIALPFGLITGFIRPATATLAFPGNRRAERVHLPVHRAAPRRFCIAA